MPSLYIQQEGAVRYQFLQTSCLGHVCMMASMVSYSELQAESGKTFKKPAMAHKTGCFCKCCLAARKRPYLIHSLATPNLMGYFAEKVTSCRMAVLGRARHQGSRVDLGQESMSNDYAAFRDNIRHVRRHALEVGIAANKDACLHLASCDNPSLGCIRKVAVFAYSEPEDHSSPCADLG